MSNIYCLVCINFFCIFCSNLQQMNLGERNKYNIKSEIFIPKIDRFKETLYNLLYANTKKSLVNVKRIETHVKVLSEPFLLKIELFNELGNSIEHDKFVRFLKYDKLCIEQDKECFINGINGLRKKSISQKSFVAVKNCNMKLCVFFEVYQYNIIKILGEDHTMIKRLLENRKDIYEAYDNLGALDIYSRNSGNNVLCLEHINVFTIDLHESIHNSFK